MPVSPRIRALNRLLPQGLARWQLSSAEALESAAWRSTNRRTELSQSTRDALGVLLTSYRTSAKLHPLGEIMSAVNVLSLLKQDLQLKATIEASPAISQRPVRAPLIITGLPRTGSTLLHNLLALDSRWRVPVSWEVTHPVPVAQRTEVERYRIAKTQLRFASIEWLSPGFKAIHELDALLPQECLVITAAAIRSHLFFSSAFVPDYQDWLDAQPQALIYESHKRLLQILQGTSDTSWALKAPSHLFSLRGLISAYPDARIVHTHRRPSEVVGSIASLQWHLYQTFSDFNDRRELGQQVCRRWSEAHHEFMYLLQESAALRERTFTLEYSAFVDNPLEQISTLYDHFGLTLGDAAATNMRNYLSQRPQHRFGKHSYELEDYGLNDRQVNDAFA